MNVKTLALGDYQTNCYIVTEGEHCLLIDPGYESPRLLSALKGLTVEAILLTHGHFDHVGGVRALAAEFDCPVYLGRRELTLPPMMSAGPLYYTHLLDEGRYTIAGFEVQVLSTPGHSPGSSCFILGDALFAGDTLFAGSCGRTDFPGSDPRAMKDSLARLSSLAQDYTVYPGHGEATTLSEEKRYNPYLR